MYGTSEIDGSVQVLRIVTEMGVHFVKTSGRISAEILRKIALMIRNHELEVKGLRTMWFGGGEGHVAMKDLKKIYATEGIALTTIPDRMLELRYKDAEGKVKYLSGATEEERKSLQQPAWLSGSRKLVNRRAGFPLNPNGTLTVLPSEFDDFAKKNGIRWYGYPDYESADGMHYIATGGNQLNLIQPFVETWTKKWLDEKAEELKDTEGLIRGVDVNLRREDLSEDTKEELEQRKKDYAETLQVQKKEFEGMKEEAKLAGQRMTEEDYIRSNGKDWQENPELVEKLFENGAQVSGSFPAVDLMQKTVSRQAAVQILFADEIDDCVIEKFVSPASPEMKEKTGCAYHALYRVRDLKDGSERLTLDDGVFTHKEWKDKAEVLLASAGLTEKMTLRKEISIENVLERQKILTEQKGKIEGNVMTPAAKEIVEQEKKVRKQEEFLDLDYTEFSVGEQNVRPFVPEILPEDPEFDKKKKLQAEVLLFQGTKNEVTVTVDQKDLHNGKVRIREGQDYLIRRNGRQGTVSGAEFLKAVAKKPAAPAPAAQIERGMWHGL